MARALVSWVSSAVAIAALAGCGGGSDPTPVVETVHCDVDGIVFSSGLFVADGTEMSVGDNPADLAIQSLVSFPLSSLPDGARVRTAVLRLYDSRLNASDVTNPHLAGSVRVEHLLADFGALDATDFASDPAALTSSGAFTSFVQGWNELEVTASVQDDLADGRSKSQFRLYRTTLTDEDDAFDVDAFYSSETPAHQPELVITYTP